MQRYFATFTLAVLVAFACVANANVIATPAALAARQDTPSSASASGSACPARSTTNAQGDAIPVAGAEVECSSSPSDGTARPTPIGPLTPSDLPTGTGTPIGPIITTVNGTVVTSPIATSSANQTAPASSINTLAPSNAPTGNATSAGEAGANSTGAASGAQGSPTNGGGSNGSSGNARVTVGAATALASTFVLVVAGVTLL